MSGLPGIVAALVLSFLWVLPGERMLSVLSEQRAGQVPIRIEAELARSGSGGSGWPDSVIFELHPELGVRVQDRRGGRWLVRGGRVIAGTGLPAPAWIPELEILALRTQEGLRTRLEQAGVDPLVNELGRIESTDCFVLGGRDAASQLWLEKDPLDVRRGVTGFGRRVHYSGWAEWDQQHFPSIFTIGRAADPEPFATLAVISVEPVEDSWGNDEGLTHTVVIGHWEYTAGVLDPDNVSFYEWINTTEVHKRPVTLMARLRAALGAD